MSDSDPRRASIRRVSLSLANDELSLRRQSLGGAPQDDLASRRNDRSSFSMNNRRSSRRDSWNFGSYEDEMWNKLIGFDELKETLDSAFGAYEGVEGLAPIRTALTELIGRFRPKQGELERYALFDYSKPYTRNCIAHTNKYTLLLLCWNPGSESRIHDHPCDACILTVLDGILKEERYANGIEGSQAKPTATKFYMEGQVSYMTDEVGLHKIYNLNKMQAAISLHLYYPPFASCSCWPQAADGTVSAHKEVVKIGTFSYRGIRTPQAEGRLSSHGQVMDELRRMRAMYA